VPGGTTPFIRAACKVQFLASGPEKMYIIQTYFAKYFHYLYWHEVTKSYSWDTRSQYYMHPCYWLVVLPTKRHARIYIQRLKISDCLTHISYHPNCWTNAATEKDELVYKKPLIDNINYISQYLAIYRKYPPRKF